MRRLAPVVMLWLALPAGGAAAQAWTQTGGEAYVKLARSWVDAADRFDLTGDRVTYDTGAPGSTYRDRSHYLYAEYGLTDRITVVGLIPIKRITVRMPGGESTTSTGAGSVMIGTRFALRDVFGLENTPFSAAASFSATLPAGYERNAAPSVGPGQVDLQGVFGAGVSLYPLPAYLQAGLGYRLRSGFFGLSRSCSAASPSCLPDERPDYDNEWLVSAEFGANISPFALVQFLVQGVYSNRPPLDDFSAINPNALRHRYTKIGLGVTLYPVPYLGLSAQYFGTPNGKNTLASSDYFLGLEYRLRRAAP